MSRVAWFGAGVVAGLVLAGVLAAHEVARHEREVSHPPDILST